MKSLMVVADVVVATDVALVLTHASIKALAAKA
jgi:hypothetical protein